MPPASLCPSSYQAVCSSHGPYVRHECCVDAFSRYSIYICRQQLAVALWGTWMSCALRGYQGRGGRRGRDERRASIGLGHDAAPRILLPNGSAGIWGGGRRWTETDCSWQTRTDSQWIQGSVAERSEQGWIKDRLTFKVLPRLVPPRCQNAAESVNGSSVGFLSH